MATLQTVKLTKGDSPNWGFRLHGGKDFGTPLVIQKVIVGSPAERAGLLAGDSVIRVQQTDVFNLRHKDAQDVLLRAGNSFDMTIQRGGSTWKPSVVPTEIFPNPSPTINISPVTRTSLAAKPSENIGAIGTGHNVSAKPFANGTLNGGPKVVNNQYNTPLKLYSEESIAETLSAQTEVLSTGALGVNFKKNEKNYDASKSAVLSLLKEEENSTKSPEHTEPHNQTAGLDAAHSPVALAGIRPVAAPENKPHSPNSQLPPGQNICADCERLIVGVFVRIKDKNLHVECFKCSTCGTSLKNVGYYNINNKLYCDIHAKLAARNNPIAPNLVPITVSPGSKAPADSISAALANHPLPTPAPLSPKINIYQSPLSGPKAFASVPGPLSPATNYNTLPRTGASLPSVAPISSPHSPTTTTVFSPCNIVWPPVSEEPELPTACPLFYPPPSQVTIKPRIRLDSIDSHSSELEKINYMEEYSYTEHDEYSSCETKSTTECAQMLTESVERQMLVENVLKRKPLNQELPNTISPRKETQEKDFNSEKTTDIPEHAIMEREYETEISSQKQSHISSKLKNPIPQQWESQMLQALKISPNDCSLHSAECIVQTEKSESDSKTTLKSIVQTEKSESDSKTTLSSISDIPIKKPITALGSALAVAPTEPFNPTSSSNTEVVPLPEETVPYFPPEDLFAISVANPVDPNKDKLFKKKIDHNLEKILEDLPKPQEKLTMRSALTTASDRPFTPSVFPSDDTRTSSPTPMFKASVRTTPIIFEKLPIEVQTICKEDTKKETNEESQIKTVKTLHKTINEMRPQTLPVFVNVENQGDVTPSPESLPLFQGFTCSFTNKSDVSQFDIQISTTPPIRDKKQKKATVRIEEKSQADLKITEMTEETTTTSTSSRREIQSNEKKEIQKTNETEGKIVYRKPSQMVVLHKSDSLPPYQVSMRETAEADLRMMAKMEKSKQKKKQQELQSEKTQRTDSSPGSVSQIAESNSTQQIRESNCEKIAPTLCPIIKVENGIIKHENSFYTVPTSHSLMSSSRPLTPSLINRPPPIIPQYQANLVAQKYGPPTVNLLNPQSPAISRSPSPCHKILETSVERPGSLRPKSPAQGPPPNPLQKDHIPTRQDFKLDEAHENVHAYISHHKEEADSCVQQMKTDAKIKANITHTTGVAVEESIPVLECRTHSILKDTAAISDSHKEILTTMHELGSTQTIDIRKNGSKPHSPDEIETVMDVFENVDSKETFRKMEHESKETSDSGIFHLEKSKRVFEEFEHSQKSKEIIIERNVKSANQEGFRNVREWENSAQNMMGLHITAPNPIKSKFLEFDQAETPPKICQKVVKDAQPTKKKCEKPPEKSTSSFPKFDATSLTKPTPLPEIPSVEILKKDILPRPTKHVNPPGSSKPNQKLTPIVPPYDVGTTGGRQAGAVGISPKRGRGILNSAQLGGRIPLCGHCHGQIRGPFITALGKIWCPNHFVCSTPSCKRPLQDLGFVEEHGQLYCEYCFEQYLAPACSKCGSKIKGDCLKAIGKAFHPECFNCVHCGVLFGNSPFFLEDGSPYCETDWNAFFTTKCFACGFPVEAGDRWVEALNNNYHSQCFNCTMCKKNLEGQSFFAKGGRPYCKSHAR